MNNIKKITTIAILFVTTIFFGQNRPDRDKIKSLKIAFITERLDLGSTEAQSFWPLYNEYEESRQALREREYHQIRNKIRDAAELSEKEATNLLNQYLDFEEEEEELDKKFLEKVSKVISAKKTLLLLRAEEEFKKQLIRQYHQKRSAGGR